jgi:serine/threonine-protein phosphatase 6 regulatory ankyrin repeat subunit B
MPRSYLTQQPKRVASLQILAGLAIVTYTAPTTYNNATKIPQELIKYLNFLNEYRDNYSLGLIVAAQEGKIEFIQDLLDLGAYTEGHTKSEAATPLLRAAQGGYLSIIELLQRNGASMNALSSQKANALIIAAGHGQYSICEYLIKQNVYINAQTQCGRSALMFATIYGHEQTCKLLVDNGALIQLVDEDSKTALHFAAEEYAKTALSHHEKEQKYKSIIRLLLDATK